MTPDTTCCWPSAAQAKLAPVSAALAEELFVHDQAWLQEVADLLAEKRQIVLYGWSPV